MIGDSARINSFSELVFEGLSKSAEYSIMINTSSGIIKWLLYEVISVN